MTASLIIGLALLRFSFVAGSEDTSTLNPVSLNEDVDLNQGRAEGSDGLVEGPEVTSTLNPVPLDEDVGLGLIHDTAARSEELAGGSEVNSTLNPVSLDEDVGLMQGRAERFNYHVGENSNRLNAKLFLNSFRAYSVVKGLGHIRGITVLDSQLFVVRDGSNKVNVYNTNTLALIHTIKITLAKDLRAIVASPQYNALYMSDPSLKLVYHYSLSLNSVLKSWHVDGECHGLSLTSTQNVLVTLYDTKQVKEYSPDGILQQVRNIDSSLVYLWHTVQLSTGKHVVSHGSENKGIHRVCVEGTSSLSSRCTGGVKGTGIGQFNGPCNLVVDVYDNVLVADFKNNRVALLGPSLNHLGYITIPGYTLSGPWALHLDKLTRRLYIGEFTTGRIIVLTM